MRITEEIISECRRKLLLMREELLNRMRSMRLEVTAHEKMAGDEVDQTQAQITENQFALNQSRVRNQILEVDQALARIQRGSFGICEETDEQIEVERLLAIPFTRLSIEGAEIRESLHKVYAR